MVPVLLIGNPFFLLKKAASLICFYFTNQISVLFVLFILSWRRAQALELLLMEKVPLIFVFFNGIASLFVNVMPFGSQIFPKLFLQKTVLLPLSQNYILLIQIKQAAF